MFAHANPVQPYLDYEDLICETRTDGRKYITPNGTAYPSVTSVLSILSRDSINKWKKRVGIEKAESISRKASTRGTQVHEIIEKYVDNNPTYFNGYFPHVIDMFNTIKPEVDKIEKVFLQECALYSDHLGLAGRVDCVGVYKGKMSIIDFKTSSRPKKKEWIDSYFCQCAAYSIMWEERTGIPIENLVVMVAVDGGVSQVFEESRDNWTAKLIETISQYKEEQKCLNG
jgi:genome maintenance exonuclease 1